jgi:UDP-3-O-[3-hydroxymyristoyl] glucosamine N-acyltransferase
MRGELDPAPTLAAIAARIGASVRGDASRPIRRLASLRSADEHSLSLLVRANQREAASQSRAAALITSAALADALGDDANLIVSEHPHQDYARIAEWVDGLLRPRPAPGIHPSAVVDPAAVIGAGVLIEAGAVVGPRVVLGAGCWIGAGCQVGPDTRIGEHSRLHPRVTIVGDCEIGDRVLIHSGTVIGADGFGLAPAGDGRWEKIAQLGGVVIGDDVEIGANCCVDRGALDDTVIERGCKLDNLIQIGHGARIGEDTAIAACAGVAGSAVIGKRCQIGGASGIAGHITIADGTIVSTMTLISHSIREPGFFSGIFPMMDNADWERAAVVVRHLPDLRRRLRALERALAERASPQIPETRAPGATDER